MKGYPGIEQLGPRLFKVYADLGVVDGKRVRKTKRVHGTVTQAVRVRTRLLLQAGKPIETDMTLHDFCFDVWLPQAKIRQKTRDDYVSKLDLHIMPYLGSYRLPSVTPYVIESWLTRLSDEGKSDWVRAGAFRVLRAALGKAVKWEMLERSPADRVDAPQPPKRELDNLATVEDLNAYLDAFEGHWAEVGLALELGGGFRLSEIGGLTWNDIAFEWFDDEDGKYVMATVRVRRTLQYTSQGYVHEDTKTVSGKRDVDMPPWASTILWRHKDVGPVLKYRTRSLTQAYRRILRDAGLHYVAFRDLRHSHATMTLDIVGDLHVVKDRLGHRRVATTDAFYIGRRRGADHSAAKKLDTVRCHKVTNQKSAQGGSGR